MKQTLILFFTTALVFLTSGVQAQWPNANNTAVNITLSGCGVTKLCLETPSGCDPAGNSTCLFGSVKVRNLTAVNGPKLAFQLSGNSTGYVALGLSSNSSQNTSMLFVCAQNNSINASFFFMTETNTNGMLTSLVMNVTNIRGVVNNNNIQCEFHVMGLNASSNTTMSPMGTTYTVLLGYGAVNMDGSLGSFQPSLKSGPLDLTNPAANVATTTSTPSNTSITSTTAASGANRAFYSNAALLLMSVLTLSALKTV